MSPAEQITAFAAALDKLVDNYRHEFDLPYAAVVGVLHLKAHLLCAEASAIDEDEE